MANTLANVRVEFIALDLTFGMSEWKAQFLLTIEPLEENKSAGIMICIFLSWLHRALLIAVFFFHIKISSIGIKIRVAKGNIQNSPLLQ